MDNPNQQSKLKNMASSMGIAYYQYFSEDEAAQFLGVTIEDLSTIKRSGFISYLQVTPTQISFLGFQLLEYLINTTREKSKSLEKTSQATPRPDTNLIQILRFPEVRKLTGLSRTTVWRMEKKDDFPKRVRITSTLVGWHRADIEEWVANRSKI